jgi:hypothetical protein
MRWRDRGAGRLVINPAVRTPNRMWSSANHKPAALVLADRRRASPATLVTNDRRSRGVLAGRDKIASRLPAATYASARRGDGPGERGLPWPPRRSSRATGSA